MLPTSLEAIYTEVLEKYRGVVVVFLFGLILILLGLFIYKNYYGEDKVEIIDTASAGTTQSTTNLIVEVAGAVVSPGVYELPQGSRVENALIMAGGISAEADREYLESKINRASKLVDGQKIYIKKQSEVLSANFGGQYQTTSRDNFSDSEGKTNINSASLNELDKLPGIGPVYGQKIIDNRMYTNIDELQSKEILPKNVFEKIKDKIVAP